MRPAAMLSDGINPPRPVQKDYLRHLYRNYSNHRVFGAHLPPGSGKTWLARAIQREFGNDCMVITVSNHLLDQFKSTYTDVNHIKGRQHYDNMRDYKEAYEAAKAMPTIANPLSYFYGLLSGRLEPPKALIIDEAHKLYDTMFLAAYMDFPVQELSIPTFKDNYDLSKWVYDLMGKFEERLPSVHELPENRQNQFYALYDKFSMLKHMVSIGSHAYTFDYTYSRKNRRSVKVLRITPVNLTREFFKPFLQCQKVFMMSGTLTKFDLNFYDSTADYYTSDYLTRWENRKILFRPIHEQQRKCPETIASKILSIYEDLGRKNTVVHVTYDMGKKLAKILPDFAITHDKGTKTQAVERFKKDGGLLIASGCAEGIDLPDDQCRVIIIPVLLYPNLGDETVRLRRSMRDGVFRYNLETMMTTVQQIGRGARHSDDSCVSYILDPMFSLLYSQTYNHLPNDLNVDWRSA